MANDVVFRWSLVWLAAIVVAIGLYTQSFKKMFVSYLFGMLGIAGLLLPDWDFFDRDVSQWCSPLHVDKLASNSTSNTNPNFSHRSTTSSNRFRIYPIRLIVYTLVYGFALYKWWMFVSN